MMKMEEILQVIAPHRGDARPGDAAQRAGDARDGPQRAEQWRMDGQQRPDRSPGESGGDEGQAEEPQQQGERPPSTPQRRVVGEDPDVHHEPLAQASPGVELPVPGELLLEIQRRAAQQAGPAEVLLGLRHQCRDAGQQHDPRLPGLRKGARRLPVVDHVGVDEVDVTRDCAERRDAGRDAAAGCTQFDDGVIVVAAPVGAGRAIHAQLRRFRAREDSPHKRHKMTPEDYRNRRKWDDNLRAAEVRLTADQVKRLDAAK